MPDLELGSFVGIFGRKRPPAFLRPRAVRDTVAGMPPIPPELVAVIEAYEGEWSDHALDGADRLELHWEDVVSVAQSSEDWKRTRDTRGVGSYVDAMVGRDTYGRRIYMAGKVRTRADEALWYVITIHEAN